VPRVDGVAVSQGRAAGGRPVSRLRIVFAEALRSIGANISTTIASGVSVLIGMFLIGVFIGLGTWLVSWSDDKKRELAVHVYIADAATGKQVDRLRVALESDPRVRPGGIAFVSKQRALDIMRKRNPELTENLVSNPLPASFDVVPKRGEDTEAIAATIEKKNLVAVEEVRWGKGVARRILAIARAIQIISLIIVIVLLAASTILIANTIRLSIFARRREIEVMKLVGASNWFVRGPFMLEGVLTGLAGSLAAVLLLFLGREIAIPKIVTVQNDPQVQALAFTWTATILVLIGLAIGALGSSLTLRRFLRV
jgi:cell division transport system permease protein